MASAVFVIEDTKAARSELALLLQIEPSKLDRVTHNGYLTVEFPNLLEDKAMHVISSAVANHGFKVSITDPSRPAKVEAEKPKTSAAPGHKPQPQGPEKGSK